MEPEPTPTANQDSSVAMRRLQPRRPWVGALSTRAQDRFVALICVRHLPRHDRARILQLRYSAAHQGPHLPATHASSATAMFPRRPISPRPQARSAASRARRAAPGQTGDRGGASGGLASTALREGAARSPHILASLVACRPYVHTFGVSLALLLLAPACSSATTEDGAAYGGDLDAGSGDQDEGEDGTSGDTPDPGDGDGDGDGDDDDGGSTEDDPQACYVDYSDRVGIPLATGWDRRAPARLHDQLLLGAEGSLSSLDFRSDAFLAYYRDPSDVGDVATLEPRVELWQGALDGYGTWHLDVTVRTPDPADFQRPRMRLVAVLDDSQRMGTQGLALAKSALLKLTADLRDGDELALIRMSQSLEPISIAWSENSQATVTQLVGSIEVGEAASMDAALSQGLMLAQEGIDLPNQLPPSQSSAKRIVVLSDGELGVNQDTLESLALARDLDPWLTLAGVELRSEDGGGSTLESLVGSGGGSLLYAGELGQLERQLDDAGVAWLVPVAQQLRSEITLPPGFVIDSGAKLESTQWSLSTKMPTPPAPEVDGSALHVGEQNLTQLQLATCLAVPDLAASKLHLHVDYVDPTSGADSSIDVPNSLADLLVQDEADLVRVYRRWAITRYAGAMKAWIVDGNKLPIASALAAVEAVLAIRPKDEQLGEIHEILLAAKAAASVP